MVKEVVQICKKYKVNALINTGDFKNTYNPVDVRVINFGIEASTIFENENIPFWVELGNHDRIGLYDDKQNWLQVLAEAGAKVFDSPTVHKFGYPDKIHFLPFMTDKDELKRAAKELSLDANPLSSILVFHEDIKGCYYNLMTKSEGKITPNDLCPDRYLFCIGGHIHLQHRVKGNIWYAGSPFAMDWGEANQIKGYLLVDTKTKEIKQIPSQYPGLYDPLWPDFDKVKRKDWTGAEVRVHVQYDNSVHDLQALSLKTKQKAQQEYPGAHIVTVTEYISEDKSTSFLDEDSSDEEHIEEYVRQTCWDHLTTDRDTIVAYLHARLKEVGIRARQNSKLDFIRGKGSNFLSFKSIELDYTQPGITLVTGQNLDWAKRSNGSGKTNALQIPSVAMTGETFKGQKHDRWARRRSVKKAFALFECRTKGGKRYKITRCRRPHKLKLQEWTGTKWFDISSGNKKGSMEQLIEEKLGVTQQMLSSAIYIDCARTNLLLSGRDSDRKKLLEEFQNLERYAKALVRVKKDQKKATDAIYGTEDDIKECVAGIEAKKEIIAGIDTDDLVRVRKEFARLDAIVDEKKQNLDLYLKKNNATYKVLGKEKNDLTEELEEKIEKLGNLTGRREISKTAKEKFLKLGGTCPVCKQEITPNQIQKHVNGLNQELSAIQTQIGEIVEERDALKKQIDAKNTEMAEIQAHGLEKNRELTATIRERDQKKSEYQQLKKFEDLKEEQEESIQRLEKRKKVLEEDLHTQKNELAFYEYCMESFSRKGLPAFLNGLLCPRLNKAAQYYSKLFADGEVQVVFETDNDGDFTPKVINAFGGETIEDQSRGETSIASLITSFAQTVLMQSNILILDEPGEGLDAVNARKFAQGLKTIAPRFGGIWITTHNVHILSELSGERELKVVKRDGISRIEH